MNKPPAYQHYAKEWLVDTAHLSLEEQGAYLRLLDHQWVNGVLPTDERDRAKLLSLTLSAFRRIWRRIGGFFPGGLNPALEEIRQEQQKYRESLAASGRLGAERRWHKKDREANGDPNGDPDGLGNGETMRLQSVSASAPNVLKTAVPSEPAGAAPHKHQDDQRAPHAVLMPIIRELFYAPDGKPPADWDEDRDGHIVKMMLKQGHSVDDLEAGIRGLRDLVDQPGVWVQDYHVDFARPHEKLTMRMLYNTRLGQNMPALAVATQAYWSRVNSRRSRASSPSHISDTEALRVARAK